MTNEQRSPVSIYNEFTHKYKLSKTLRFQLIPQGETQHFLEEHKVVEKDTRKDEAYQQLKPLIDNLHREFINVSLAPELVSDIDFTPYKISITDKKKDTKKIENALKKISGEIVKAMDVTATDWKERYAPDSKKKGVGFMMSADILGVLGERHKDDAEAVKAIVEFNNFTTYLGKFQETRENLYKSDGTATAISTRIVTNYAIYYANQEKLAKAKHGVQFSVDTYSHYFRQKDIDCYNETIGKYNKEVKQLRDQVNKDEKNEYPLLKTLQNQILSEKEIENDEFEITEENIKAQYTAFVNDVRSFSAQSFQLLNTLLCSTVADPIKNNGIFLNNRAINSLSRRWFIDWFDFEMSLTEVKGNKKPETPKIKPFVSIAEIAGYLGDKKAGEVFKDTLFDNKDEKDNEREKSEFARDYFVNKFQQELQTIEALLDVPLENKTPDQEGFNKQNEGDIDAMRTRLDAGLHMVQVMKYFVINGLKSTEKPSGENVEFYNVLDELVGDLRYKHDIIKRYDAFRNFFTKKIDAKDKIKLNFDSGTLLSGFDKNKEPEKRGIILRKDNSYYVGIINKKDTKIFDDTKYTNVFDVSGDVYEKMEYKLFPDPKRMILKVAFASKNTQVVNPSGEILKLRDEYKAFQESKKDNFSLQFDSKKLAKLIKFYQHTLTVLGYKKTYDLTWKSADAYINLGEFNDEISRQQYKIKFRNVSTEYVSNLVRDGKLYLFKIHSKDFQQGAVGNKNIHTLYFLNLFSVENIESPTLKLSGGAEIFFRDKKLESKQKVGKKEYTVEKKRYTAPRYLFHVPIELNTNSADRLSQFNKNLNKDVLAQRDVAVIGVDRGEKHLLYISLIDSKGNILITKSLNQIEGPNGKLVNYKEKLEKKEKERENARRSWKTIQQIKNLKKGYMSLVVHELIKMAIEHNAIIVLEDLNMRFKQVRGGVERSVYQQMEKALIDKLGYVVFKDKESTEPGGVMNAYQLTSPFESFEKLGKQTGILFYTTAEYTSTTDPITGWRRHIYLKSSESQKELLKIFTSDISNENKAIKICWNEKLQSYTFTYDQKDFDSQLPSRLWELKADVSRLMRYKDNKDQIWKTDTWNPNYKMKKLMEEFGFTNHECQSEDISELIAEKFSEGNYGEKKKWRGEYGREEHFLSGLAFVLHMVQQIRNATTGEVQEYGSGKTKERGKVEDFIASPVAPYYSNRVGEENTCDLDQIKDGDALGAYNIARKGIMMLKRIKENPEKPDLFIKRAEWDKWAQEHNKLD